MGVRACVFVDMGAQAWAYTCARVFLLIQYASAFATLYAVSLTPPYFSKLSHVFYFSIIYYYSIIIIIIIPLLLLYYLSKTFLILRRIQENVINVKTSSLKCPLFLTDRHET